MAGSFRNLLSVAIHNLASGHSRTVFSTERSYLQRDACPVVRRWRFARVVCSV
jgi:hypothetical protein